MRNRFKNKDKVFVYGPGENAGKFYKKQPAYIIERDSYYLDYLVKFKDGTEDWIEEKYLRKLSMSYRPLFQIGKDGISYNLIKTISDSLEARGDNGVPS